MRAKSQLHFKVRGKNTQKKTLATLISCHTPWLPCVLAQEPHEHDGNSIKQIEVPGFESCMRLKKNKVWHCTSNFYKETDLNLSYQVWF